MFLNFHSVFQSQIFSNSLSSTRQRREKKKKALPALMLTSLIDAFSILVVYLLMFFSDAGEMAYVSSDIDLPKATAIDRLDRHSIIQIKKEGYFVEERKLTAKSLVPYLVNLKKQLNRSSPHQNEKSGPGDIITIQADKTVKYKRLSPVIQACGHAGFSHIKFAVLSE